MGPATANGAIIWIVIAMAAAASAYAQNAASIPSGAAKVLPKGVDPESFARLPPLKGADLDEEGMRVYDTLAGGPDKEGGCDGSAAYFALQLEAENQHLRPNREDSLPPK